MRSITTNDIDAKPFGRLVSTYSNVICTNLREVWCSIALAAHCTKPEIGQSYCVCCITALDGGAFCYNLVHTFYNISPTYPEDVRGFPKL